jgi:hypothetical protein
MAACGENAVTVDIGDVLVNRVEQLGDRGYPPRVTPQSAER